MHTTNLGIRVASLWGAGHSQIGWNERKHQEPAVETIPPAAETVRPR
jgi:hypothetical protein